MTDKSYNKIASFRKSERKYFVASRWTTGDTEYSGICEMVEVNKVLQPTINGNRMFWRSDLDDQILMLVEKLLNETHKANPHTKVESKVAKDKTGK